MNFKQYFPLYRKNLLLAGPVVLSQMGVVTVSLVDNMMVGHVGTTELAAASFANSVFTLGLVLGMGVCMGLTPLVGKVFSQQKEHELAKYLKNGFVSHGGFAILISLAMFAVSFFLDNMGQPTEVVEKAVPYYLIMVSSLFPFFIFYSFKQFLEGIGNTSIAMYITLLSNGINIGLNYLLIFGKWGFPELGLLGAGWASFISRVFMPFLLIPFLFKRKNYWRIAKEAVHSKVDWLRMREILSVGVPIGLQLIVEVTTFAAGAVMMGWLGKEELAGHQVALGLATVTYMISLGISSGTTIRVSHEFGVHSYVNLRRTIYASLHLVITFMASMGVGFVLLRHQLPLLFTSDAQVILVAAQLLIVAALFQVFDGIQVVLLGALRGLSDVSAPMIMAFFAYSIVGLPISYLCAFVFQWGAVGIWLGFLFGLALAAVLFSFRLKRLSSRFI